MSGRERKLYIKTLGCQMNEYDSRKTAELLAAWRRPVQLTPERADSWYELGAHLFHDGAAIGRRAPNVRAFQAPPMQFVRGVARDGLPQALFSVVQCLICLIVPVMIIKAVGYDLGYAAGLYSGSQTISAAMGLSTDAINRLGQAPDETKALLDSMPIAYAVTYMFGTMGSAIVIAYALLIPSGVTVVLLALSPIGALQGWQMIVQMTRPQSERMAWFYSHMGNMIGAGIAFHTAFAVFGSARIFDFELPGVWQIVPWVLPAAIGIPANRILETRYRQRFNEPRRGRKRAMSPLYES